MHSDHISDNYPSVSEIDITCLDDHSPNLTNLTQCCSKNSLVPNVLQLCFPNNWVLCYFVEYLKKLKLSKFLNYYL